MLRAARQCFAAASTAHFGKRRHFACRHSQHERWPGGLHCAPHQRMNAWCGCAHTAAHGHGAFPYTPTAPSDRRTHLCAPSRRAIPHICGALRTGREYHLWHGGTTRRHRGVRPADLKILFVPGANGLDPVRAPTRRQPRARAAVPADTALQDPRAARSAHWRTHAAAAPRATHWLVAVCASWVYWQALGKWWWQCAAVEAARGRIGSTSPSRRFFRRHRGGAAGQPPIGPRACSLREQASFLARESAGRCGRTHLLVREWW